MRDYQMRTTTLLMRGKDIWGQMWQRMDIDTHIAVMQNTQQICNTLCSAVFFCATCALSHCSEQLRPFLGSTQTYPALTTYFYYAHKNIK